MRKATILIGVSLVTLGFISRVTTTPYPFPVLWLFPKMPVAVNNPVTVEGVNLGRHLFYDPILSSDSTMSCGSCHSQANAFSDAPNQFSKGRNGMLMKRNTLPLFNLAWNPSLFWDGRASSIEDQVFHPVRTYDEMNLEWNVASERLQRSKFYKPLFRDAFGDVKIDSTRISYAIAQFLRTLISYQSKFDRVMAGKELFTKDEYDGYVLANEQTKGDCIHCHITDGDVLGTTLAFSNNGLDTASAPESYRDKGRGNVTGNVKDNGKFRVPSLRNLAFTAPYMHDGRFATLEEVIEFYSSGVKRGENTDSKMEYAHQGGVNMSVEEKKKIIAFMLTLSDSVFISKREFGNPFIEK